MLDELLTVSKSCPDEFALLQVSYVFPVRGACSPTHTTHRPDISTMIYVPNMQPCIRIGIIAPHLFLVVHQRVHLFRLVKAVFSRCNRLRAPLALLVVLEAVPGRLQQQMWCYGNRRPIRLGDGLDVAEAEYPVCVTPARVPCHMKLDFCV